MRRKERVSVDCSAGSLTKQYFKDDCDINQIVSKYTKTGYCGHVREVPGRYGDFSCVDDYHSAMTKVSDAQEQFHSLPAKVRKRFSNDVSELLDFLGDPENAAEAVALGLIEKPVEQAAPAVEVEPSADA